MLGRKKEEEKRPQAEDLEKKLAELLGNLPDRVGSLKKYVGNLVDVIHYYFDRFGPYLPSPMRKDWTKLVLLSDMLSLDMESVRNRIETLETRIRKELLVNGSKGINKRQKKELEEELEELEKKAEELRKKTKELLLRLMKYVEETGIE